MKTTEANIEIKRKDGVLLSISVIMPTWNKGEDDGLISVNIPLFGLKTIARDIADSDIAIKEAITCFCIAAEKFGKGIEFELQNIGWSVAKQNINSTLLNYTIESDNLVLEQIMETGEQYAENDLAIAS